MFNLSFDDVLLVPKFSKVSSRADVNTNSHVAGMNLSLPIISSNMDTVTESKMAHAMFDAGGIGCLHRFQSIENNIKQFEASPYCTWVSFGLGGNELERAKALYDVGASVFVLDVAHGASMEVVKQVQKFRSIVGSDALLVVGNFATGQTIKDFEYHLGNAYDVDTYKVGIGSGAACITQVVTGHGVPIFGSVFDCVKTGKEIICDGGVRNSGDFVKAIAAGAKAVMMGRVLAGTKEAPGELLFNGSPISEYQWIEKMNKEKCKKSYRGSASQESYQVQGKEASHRTAEGEAYLIPYTGTVEETLQPFEAGLRSGMSYSGAFTLEEFQEKAEFVYITTNGAAMAQAHGKNN